jgi:hypothetical protein
LILLDIMLEVLVNAIRQEKEIKNTKIGKEVIKPCLFTDCVIISVGNQIIPGISGWVQKCCRRFQSLCMKVNWFLIY